MHSTIYSVFRISEYKVLSDRMFVKWLTKMDLKGKCHELIQELFRNFTGKNK